MTESPNETQTKTPGPANSTLIEFPGVNRNRPAWRKELSEKVREIQQRRAREAELEAEAELLAASAKSAFPPEVVEDSLAGGAEPGKQLGLVPPPAEVPVMNPLVAAALRRIERARAQTAPRPSHGRAQAATARVIEEHYEQEDEAAPALPPPPRPAAVPVARAEAAPAPKSERSEQAEKSERAENSPTTPAPAGLLVVAAAPRPQTRTAPSRPAAADVSARLETRLEADATDAIADARSSSPVASAVTVGPAEAGVKAEASAPAAGYDEPTAANVRAAALVSAAVETASVPASAARPTAETLAAGAPQVVTPRTVAARVGANAGASAAEVAARPQPRKVSGVIDDHWLERRGVDLLPKVEAPGYDDRAPFSRRTGAAVLDLLAVAVLCAPFAAVIELTIGEWGDARVLGSMGGVAALVTFLYHTCAVALAGRTPGMRLFSLHAVDADTASVPTTGQCARRAFFYLISLAAFGLGLLYALLDAEGRTLHDLASRTVVVRE